MGNFCQWIVYLLLNNFSILQMGGASLTGKATKPMKIYTVIHIFQTGVFAGQFWSLGLIFDTPDLNCPDIAASLFWTHHCLVCTPHRICSPAQTQHLEHFVSLVKSKLFRWILSLTFNTSQVELSQQQCYGPPGTFNLLLICVIVPVYSVVYVCMLFTGKYRLKGKTLAWLNCTSKLEINI